MLVLNAGARSSNPHDSVVRSFGDTGQGHGVFWKWREQWFHVWCQFTDQNNTGVPVPDKSYHRWRNSWMT